MGHLRTVQLFELFGAARIAVRVAGCGLRVTRYGLRVTGCGERGYALPLKFLKDTHDNFIDEIKGFLEKYDKLGAKINKYIQYVEKEWR